MIKFGAMIAVPFVMKKARKILITKSSKEILSMANLVVYFLITGRRKRGKNISAEP